MLMQSRIGSDLRKGSPNVLSDKLNRNSSGYNIVE